jgi:hypothetical protein
MVPDCSGRGNGVKADGEGRFIFGAGPAVSRESCRTSPVGIEVQAVGAKPPDLHLGDSLSFAWHKSVMSVFPPPFSLPIVPSENVSPLLALPCQEIEETVGGPFRARPLKTNTFTVHGAH